MKDLKKNHKTLNSYLNDRAPIFFITLARDGLILDSNQYAQKATGRPLVGENIHDVIVDFAAHFDLTAAAEQNSKEHIINIPSASRLPQSYYFSFQKVDDHILAFGRLDTDEIENMRTEILSLNRDLNNLTRELHKQNAMLKRLNKEKNQFLGMASHDLRKPIGVVMSYTEFLIDDVEQVLEKEQAGFLHTIHDACSYMKRLVDDFLDVSAIEAGKFDLDLHPTDLDAFLSECLRFNTHQAAKKGVTLRVTSDRHLPRITMDAPKIQQAMTNLVSNAIEHSQPEDVLIITLSSDGSSIFCSICDSGPGIAPEEIKRLFRPFETTGAKKTAGEKSTGLGLLITRKIIASHGGEISVDSTVGKGTTINFKLPLNPEVN